MRQNAENWLEVADRVYKYRRDQLNVGQLAKLTAATGEVKLRLKEKADASKLKMSVESLEGVLRDTGGRIYPVSSIVENVEFFLVAAIVILGLRAYFVQPFKIPTNSMWPTYYGMTAEVFQKGEEPSVAQKAARLVTLGASNYNITAPADGEILVPVFANSLLTPAYTEIAGRSLFIFPTILSEYSLSVGGQLVKFKAPSDWARGHMGYEKVLHDTFFPKDSRSVSDIFQQEIQRKAPESSTMLVQQSDRHYEVRVMWIPTGKHVRKGEVIMNFDVLTGDLLFVDRMTYNFFPPKVGSGFVFKTENIKNDNMRDASGNLIQAYYIKRLVGVPGDTLEIKPPELWRNGKPIDGADTFARNAHKEGLYPGYAYGRRQYGIEYMTEAGAKVTIPEKSYFAMGDNSPDSQDSRYWGFVPEKDIVGRPLFIYYPLTSRWGPAK